MFLIYLLNVIQNQRYIEIFIDLLPDEIEVDIEEDEEFQARMVKALLSDHKIDRYEKINIKTITQQPTKDCYIKLALTELNKKISL